MNTPRGNAESVAKTDGMSDAEFDRWVEQQGGQPVSKELWERLAKSGIFPELPPRGTAMVEKERDLVATIRGSWSGKLSSSDEFAARKADEISLEK
jgi:hypothetical protein